MPNRKPPKFWRKNYDYGEGFYQNIQNQTSVKDFLDKHHADDDFEEEEDVSDRIKAREEYFQSLLDSNKVEDDSGLSGLKGGEGGTFKEPVINNTNIQMLPIDASSPHQETVEDDSKREVGLGLLNDAYPRKETTIENTVIKPKELD